VKELQDKNRYAYAFRDFSLTKEAIQQEILSELADSSQPIATVIANPVLKIFL
jgi:hypothetical protein